LNNWQLITGEYPPQPGGVSDYSRLVAIGLANAGDRMTVWAPSSDSLQSSDAGVTVRRLPGHFGPGALAVLDRALDGHHSPRILVQYVPHAYGFKAMNIPFAIWLYARRKLDISVMFHEVAFPFRVSQPLRRNALAAATYAISAIAARSARRIFISTSSWEEILRKMVPDQRPMVWLPVPSNIPVVDDCEGVLTARKRYACSSGSMVGHFGTYGEGTTELLDQLLPAILNEVRSLSVLLVGRNSDRYSAALIRKQTHLAPRIHASGAISDRDVSMHISACDLMLQPYPDGISTRRTSAISGLAHGRAIVTTSGHLTESLWAESGAVALSPVNDLRANAALGLSILFDPVQRRRLERSAQRLYCERFDIGHTIDALRKS
jgi:glycosyltransferase involved in cell wall biosynthesis